MLKAFDNTFRRYRINGVSESSTLEEKSNENAFFNKIRKNLVDLIKTTLEELPSVKIQTATWIKFTKENDDNSITEVDKVFNSNMEVVHQETDLHEVLDVMFTKMKEQIDNPKLKDSKFVLDRILYLDVDFHNFKLTRVSLPKHFSGKRSIINPKNRHDEECFKWAIIAALHHHEIKNNPERIENLRKYVDKYNWKKLEFPTPLNKIELFERRNSDIAVHVLTSDSSQGIYLCRKSKYINRKQQVYLFLLCEGEKKHYIAIKNLSGVLRKLNSKHEGKEHYCINCLSGFSSLKRRDEHFEFCMNNDAAKIEMPPKGSKVKFHDG